MFLSLGAIAITLLVVTAILGVLFYFMYHTFHGKLPNIMKIVVAIFLLVATVFGILHFLG